MPDEHQRGGNKEFSQSSQPLLLVIQEYSRVWDRGLRPRSSGHGLTESRCALGIWQMLSNCLVPIRRCLCCARASKEYSQLPHDEHADSRSSPDIEVPLDPTLRHLPLADEATGCDEVHQSFLNAVVRVKALPSHPPPGSPSVSNSTRLRLYALYKQATDAAGPPAEPSRFQVVARAKWEAWESVRHLPPSTAEQMYAKLVADLLPQAESKPAEKKAR